MQSELYNPKSILYAKKLQDYYFTQNSALFKPTFPNNKLDKKLYNT